MLWCVKNSQYWKGNMPSNQAGTTSFTPSSLWSFSCCVVAVLCQSNFRILAGDLASPWALPIGQRSLCFIKDGALA
jgi:hypothetical protein